MRGYYQPFLSATNETACLKCVEHSTTLVPGATSLAECACEGDFILNNGECMCPAGFGLETAGGAERCAPCAFGKYKDEPGNIRCTDCPFEEVTTASMGSTALEQCVCKAGSYMAPDLNSSAGSTCSLCENTEQIDKSRAARGDARGYECRKPGATLGQLPVAAGFWRQSNQSRFVRPCFTAAACVGGSNSTQYCAVGHTGPYCANCDVGFNGGADGVLCAECSESPGGDIAVAIGLFFAGIAVFGLVLFYGRKGQRTMMERFTKRAIASLHENGEAWHLKAAIRAEAERMFREDHPRLDASYRWWAQHAVSMQVKLRILISLYQVLSGIGIVFSIKYPPIYYDLLRFNPLNFDIDLPNLLPLGCVMTMSFFERLAMRTSFPFAVYIIFGFIASRLRAQVNAADKPKKSKGLMSSRKLSRSMTRTFKETTSSGNKQQLDFIAELCDNISFFTMFLVYPTCSQAIFSYLVCDELDGAGEDGQRYLRVDFSIDCNSTEYYLFLPYVLVCVAIYPIGVPLLYTKILFSNRNLLRLLQGAELAVASTTKEMEREQVEIDAGRLTQKEEVEMRAMMAQQANYIEKSKKRLEELKGKMNGMVRKLTAGYELRTYWFEVFECCRKIALVGLPVICRPGSAEQLIIGLFVAFATFAAYTSIGPFIGDADDMLMQVCQVQIFISLLAGIALRTGAESPVMTYILVVFTICPPVLAIVSEILMSNARTKLRGEADKETLSIRLRKSCMLASISFLDRRFKTPTEEEIFGDKGDAVGGDAGEETDRTLVTLPDPTPTIHNAPQSSKDGVQPSVEMPTVKESAHSIVAEAEPPDAKAPPPTVAMLNTAPTASPTAAPPAVPLAAPIATPLAEPTASANSTIGALEEAGDAELVSMQLPEHVTSTSPPRLATTLSTGSAVAVPAVLPTLVLPKAPKKEDEFLTPASDYDA